MVEFLGGLSGLVLTAVATGILRPLAQPLGLIDHPDPRKRHGAPVPLVGGLAILAGFLGTAGLLRLVFPLHFPEWPPYLLCVALLVVVGILDDAGSRIGPGIRALLQLAIALIAAFSAHVILSRLGNLWGTGAVETGPWAIPFTVLCLLGVTNALNLIDGVDGLAGLVSLAPLFWIGLFATANGRRGIGVAVSVLAGALVAFLLSNFEHAWRRHRVFLGSVGSTFLGFTLAWLLVHLSQAPHRELPPIVAVWLLGLPILDTVNVMLRRILHGRSPLHGGRDHLHHLLALLGLSSRSIALAETAAAFLLGGVGYAGWIGHWPTPLLTWGFLALALVYFSGFVILDRRLGWVEDPEGMLPGEAAIDEEEG